jgi:hypothetical protein
MEFADGAPQRSFVIRRQRAGRCRDNIMTRICGLNV